MHGLLLETINPMCPSDFDRLLADAALGMAREESVPATVERALTLATDAIAACDAALLFVMNPSGVRASAGSDPLLLAVVEQHVADGDALVSHAFTSVQPAYLPDTSLDSPWGGFAHLSGAGIASAYAVPLLVDTRPLGVLGLYARKPHAFDCEDQETARLVAAHVAAALAGTTTRVQLAEAVESRTVIGQAVGIVMTHYQLDADTAFHVLRRLSQTQNRKLRDIATEVVATGRM